MKKPAILFSILLNLITYPAQAEELTASATEAVKNEPTPAIKLIPNPVQETPIHARILKGNFMFSGSAYASFDLTAPKGERHFTTNFYAAPMIFVSDCFAVGGIVGSYYRYSTSHSLNEFGVGPAARYYFPLTEQSSFALGFNWRYFLGFIQNTHTAGGSSTVHSKFVNGLSRDGKLFYNLNLEASYNYFLRDDLSISPGISLEKADLLQLKLGYSVEKYF